MTNQNRKTLRRYVKIAIPISAIVVGIILLAGCLYIPLPEHKVGPETDFRELIGDPHSGRPIRAGAISRASVEQLLGKPQYISDDRRVTGYTVTTDGSFVIWPTCFVAGPDRISAYALRLEFDDRNMLISLKTDHADINTGGSNLWTKQDVRNEAMRAFATTSPSEHPHELHPATQP
ncbi:MAG TPA: hypothetical protein VFE47_18935 [Tepidisphaeraceae bacterium]|jgi:hypothetical protein|nr:hypothetical protein [Tepidisphaeraceae bacterium]